MRLHFDVWLVSFTILLLSTSVAAGRRDRHGRHHSHDRRQRQQQQQQQQQRHGKDSKSRHPPAVRLSKTWKPEGYPDPIFEPRKCRSDHTRFCDPDAVLLKDESRLVEEYLQINRMFHLSCSSHYSSSSDDVVANDDDAMTLVEVQIAVALVEKMEHRLFRHSGDRMRVAESFARHIHASWGVGIESSCGDTGVLFFLSKLDRAIYITRGQALESILTVSRLDNIIDRIEPILQQEEYGQAILLGLREIDYYIQLGAPELPEDAEADVVPEMAFFAMLCFCLLLTASKWKDRRRRYYTRLQSEMNFMDMRRAQSLQGHYQTSSCPICLEDFQIKPDGSRIGSDGRPVKLLRCGHVMDEMCLANWVNSGHGAHYDKCPICREGLISSRLLPLGPSPRPHEGLNSSFSDALTTQQPTAPEVTRDDTRALSIRIINLQRSSDAGSIRGEYLSFADRPQDGNDTFTGLPCSLAVSPVDRNEPNDTRILN